MKIIWLFLISRVFNSRGDRDPDYQSCLKSCKCSHVPFSQALFLWSCTDVCKYDCMQADALKRQKLGKPTERNV